MSINGIGFRSSQGFKTVNDIGRSKREYESRLHRLQTGKRLNSASDNGAELTVASSASANVVSNAMAMRNINDGMYFIQSAEATLENMEDVLDKMKTVAMQAVSDTYSDDDRAESLDVQFQDLGKELQRAAQTANYQGNSYFNNSTTTNFNIQVAGSSSSESSIQIDLTALQATIDKLGASAGTSLSSVLRDDSAADGLLASATGSGILSQSDAEIALTAIDAAKEDIYAHRNTIGVHYSRLESAYESLSSQKTSDMVTAHKIEDADYATETREAHLSNVLHQASINTMKKIGQISISAVNGLLG
jgi:flagellin